MLEESRLPSLRSMVISVNWSPDWESPANCNTSLPRLCVKPCLSGTSKGRLAKLSDSSNSSIVSVGYDYGKILRTQVGVPIEGEWSILTH